MLKVFLIISDVTASTQCSRQSPLVSQSCYRSTPPVLPGRRADSDGGWLVRAGGMNTQVFGHIIKYLEGTVTQPNSPAQFLWDTLQRLGCSLKEVLLIEKAPILGVLRVTREQRLSHRTPSDKGHRFPEELTATADSVPSCPIPDLERHD